MMYIIVALVILIGLIFLIKETGLGKFLMLLGLFFILITLLTDIIYEEGTVLILGIILFLIGLWLWWRKRKNRTNINNPNYMGPYSPSSRPSNPGIIRRMMNRKREISDAKHQEKVNYERQKAEQENQRKLHEAEVRRRAERIAKIRKRRI